MAEVSCENCTCTAVVGQKNLSKDCYIQRDIGGIGLHHGLWWDFNGISSHHGFWWDYKGIYEDENTIII